MRAGALRHRVSIESATITRDPMGGEVKAWAVIADRWANVVPLAGREFFSAQQQEAKYTARIELRYMAGITPTMRVRHGEKVYDVQAVIDLDGRNRELHLMATEAAA